MINQIEVDIFFSCLFTFYCQTFSCLFTKKSWSHRLSSSVSRSVFCILRSFFQFWAKNWLKKPKLLSSGVLHALSVASDKFFIEKFHVSVNCAFEKVMVIVIDISALDVENVVVVGRSLLFAIQTSDMEFSSVEVDLVLKYERKLS